VKKLAYIVPIAALIVGLITCIIIITAGDRAGRGKALAINDIQSDPLSFVGQITLNGIVTGFAEEDTTIFGIMDTAELLACKNPSCGAYVQPVRYTGATPLPEFVDEVDVVGTFVREDGISMPVFVATSFEVKRNVMSLLT